MRSTTGTRAAAAEILLWLVLSLAFLSALSAQDITLTPPGSPIRNGQLVMIPVSGLSSSEVQTATAAVTPAGPVLIPAQVGPSTILLFQASEPGSYTLSIGFGREHIGWRAALNETVARAAVANVEPALLERLKSLALELGTAHPAKLGSCVVEVAGTVPFPPDPDPDPKPPLPSKINRVTYVYEKDHTQIPRPVALALTKLNAGSSGSVVATEFEEDTLDGTGQVPDQYKIALESARKAGLPALVVQAGDTVVRVVKAPTTEAQVMEAVK